MSGQTCGHVTPDRGVEPSARDRERGARDRSGDAQHGLATGLKGPFERSQGLWIGWPGDLSGLGEEQQAGALRELAKLRTVPVLRG